MRYPIILAILCLLIDCKAIANSLEYLCQSTENQSKLYLRVDIPSPNDPCDISYDDDCGRVIGNYSLQSDLSYPTEMASDDDKREQITGSFNEPNQNFIEVDHEGRFSFRFPLQPNQSPTPITITSFETTKGQDSFKLYCEKTTSH